ncbi:MAG TPA: hypothetical protein VK838_00265 [Candidatus Limnocylindrales bacterium]|nr:hypothetical protein [Candidatus Limnocylindrales bacterium]
MRRVVQFFAHLTARVSGNEVEFVRSVLSPGTFRLFEEMPVADRRHGLDVASRLRARGFDDVDLLAAALLHDAAKGHRMRVWHRVAGVLLDAFAPRLLARLASDDSRSLRFPFHLYLHHAELSAQAVLAAGGPPRTAAFIRGAVPHDDAPLAIVLHAADEAS